MLVDFIIAHCGVGAFTFEDLLQEYQVRTFDEKRLIQLAKEPLLVQVNGDSMHPKFKHGDILVFDKDLGSDVPNGVYLIFYNNELIVKKVQVSTVNCILYSYNTNYAPIVITEYDNSMFYGKFIHKLKGAE